MKYFMLDIETMGTDIESDDIIQIALLELNQNSDGTYRPGLSYERLLHTSQKPKNDFIAKIHKDRLPLCHRVPRVNASQVREEILRFFQDCGVKGPAYIMGLNATTFDVPFLVSRGYLHKPTTDQNNKVLGDYHYRIYELKGAFNLAQDVTGYTDKELFEEAQRLTPDLGLPKGQSHDALYDCYKQTKILNGCILLMRRSQAV